MLFSCPRWGRSRPSGTPGARGCWTFGQRRAPFVPKFYTTSNIVDGLYHLGDKILTNFYQSRVLRLSSGSDEITLRLDQLALDDVVLEVVGGLFLILNLGCRGASVLGESHPTAKNRY